VNTRRGSNDDERELDFDEDGIALRDGILHVRDDGIDDRGDENSGSDLNSDPEDEMWIRTMAGKLGTQTQPKSKSKSNKKDLSSTKSGESSSSKATNQENGSVKYSKEESQEEREEPAMIKVVPKAKPIPVPEITYETRAPVAPKFNTTTVDASRKIVVVLYGANLETVKTKHSYQLLNCDDHANILRKNNRDLNSARPDITHQCLLTLLDSPLNKAGLLQVYIVTKKNVCIYVNPQTRIPRTFKRFSGLMVQLLHKMSIRASNGSEKLLQLVKAPITQYFPPNSYVVGMSGSGEKISCTDWALTLPKERSTVVYIGAMAHGSDDFENVSEYYSVSGFSLSASVVCGKVMNSIEYAWGVP